MYSSIHLLEHALAQFPNLLHFLDSWVVYKKGKKKPFIRLECRPPNSKRLELGKCQLDELNCALKAMK
jgi:hypothetical protein